MRRRIARIVAPYWFYTSLLVLLALFAPQITPNIELSWTAILGSYLFIPYIDHRELMNPIMLQGWTLNFEMYFYIIFALSMFLASRPVRFALLVTFLALSVLAGLFVDKSWAIIVQVTAPILLEFVMGMIVSIAWRRFKIGKATSIAFVAGGAVLLILGDLAKLGGEIRFLTFGIPAALLLFGLLGLEGYLSRSPQRVLLAAGNASYSLYLASPFVLSAVHLVVNGPMRTHLGLDGLALGLFFGGSAILASLVFSYVSFIFLEKPAGRFVSKLLAPREKDAGRAKPLAT